MREAAEAVESSKEQPLSGGDVSGVPDAEAASLRADIVDSSESAFQLGMLIAAVLMAAGGVIALVGVRNPERPPEPRPGPRPTAAAGECGRCADRAPAPEPEREPSLAPT